MIVLKCGGITELLEPRREHHDELESIVRPEKLSQILTLGYSIRRHSARRGCQPIVAWARRLAGVDPSRFRRERRADTARSLRHGNAFVCGVHFWLPAGGDSSRQCANDTTNYRNDVVAKRCRQIHRRSLHIHIDVLAKCAEQNGKGRPPAGHAVGDLAWHTFLRSVLLSDRLRITIIASYQCSGERWRRRACGHRERLFRPNARSRHSRRQISQLQSSGPRHPTSGNVSYCPCGQSQTALGGSRKS